MQEVAAFSDNALRILESRYLAYINGRRETVDEFIKRVSLGSSEYEHELIRPLVFLPNSPTLFNIDVPAGGTLSACFKFDVADTMLSKVGPLGRSEGVGNGIMDVATKSSMVIKWGGGVGYYLGSVRAKGSLVNSTHGIAMGPVALLKFYHSLASMLTQGGKRAAAQMGILPADHPDIMEFITCKDNNPQDLSTFNISVSLSDEFMEKAVTGGTKEHHVLRTMAKSAWKTGDPGVYFVSRAEQDNPTPWAGKLTGTNPCGEVPLLDDEPCNLGSINLRRFYNKDTFIDYSHLERVVRLATNYLDDVLDRNHFPIQAITDAALYTRKLGLGVCGWADLLALAHIPYTSERALDELDRVLKFIREIADDESLHLGLERGVAPCFKDQDNTGDNILSVPPTRPQYRNATRLCIAPTGSIAILMDASSGIEPHYLLSWTRTLGNGQVIQEKLAVADEIDGFIPETAMEIPWEWHVAHQATAQRHVDLAVSKTINMPNTATEEDMYNAYVAMWRAGLKGGTVYRDGCREVQVLNEVEKAYTEGAKCPECGGPVKHEEQCTECVAGCGWTACSI